MLEHIKATILSVINIRRRQRQDIMEELNRSIERFPIRRFLALGRQILIFFFLVLIFQYL